MLWPGGGAVYPPWPPATRPCQYCPGPAPGTRGTGGGLTRLWPSSHQGDSDRSGRGCCSAGPGGHYTSTWSPHLTWLEAPGGEGEVRRLLGHVLLPSVRGWAQDADLGQPRYINLAL